MLSATTRNFTESKVWNTTPKKTHWKNRGVEKSVEKMQARGKTCLLQHTTNTTHRELRKGTPKMQLQVKHTNTTTAWKCNSAPRDDDTRLPPTPPKPHRSTQWPLLGHFCACATAKNKYLTINPRNATMLRNRQPEARNAESGWRNRTWKP